MKSHQRQNADSGNVEWYTPLSIIAAAKQTMGGIDLDPFSSIAANRRIGATHIFTERENGLTQDWFGRVWMNHPYGKATNGACINKLLMEFGMGNVQEACCITFANTSEKWFRPLLCYPQCFLSPRTQYIDALTDEPVAGVTKGSVVTYFGSDILSFREAFKALGVVKI